MDKREYMYNLWEALNAYNPEIRDEIVNDYEEHFSMGHQAGKSDEEVIRELGPIDALMEDLKEIYGPGKASAKSDAADNTANAKKKTSANIEINVDEFASSLGNIISKAADAIGKGADKLGEYIANQVSYTTEQSGAFGSERGSFDNNSEHIFNESDAQKCKNLYLELEFGDVSVSKSTDGKMHFEYTNANSVNAMRSTKFDFRQEGDTAYIKLGKRENSSNFFKNLNFNSTDVKLLLPDGFCKLSISSKAGDMDVCAVSINEFEYNSTTGDVSVNNAQISVLAGKTTAGDFDANGCVIKDTKLNSMAGDVCLKGEYGKIALSSTAGDVDIKAKVTEGIDISSTCGDINIELFDCTGYQLDSHTSFGDTCYCFANNRSNLKSGKLTMGDGSLNIRCKSQCGDVSVKA